jgi:hypothetical protein
VCGHIGCASALIERPEGWESTNVVNLMKACGAAVSQGWNLVSFAVKEHQSDCVGCRSNLPERAAIWPLDALGRKPREGGQNIDARY